VNYHQMARRLMGAHGGVGTVAIAAQQVGQPIALYPQQVGTLPAQAVQNFGQRPIEYTQAPYEQGGLTYLGFGTKIIPAGATGFQVHIDTRRPFLPQQYWMPSTTFGLQIVDFVVEGKGAFANPAGQGVPNELISEVSNMPQIQWMTLNPDTGGDFFIDNPTAGPLAFSGAFWGVNVTRSR
jgi:hypothetical protein